MKRKIAAGLLAFLLSGMVLAAPVCAAETLGMDIKETTSVVPSQSKDAPFSVDGKNYDSFSDAVQVAEGKKTIVLRADITDSLTVPEGATAIVDGKGKYTIGDVSVKRSTNLTLENLTYDGGQLWVYGTLTMKNCTISERQRIGWAIYAISAQFTMEQCEYKNIGHYGIRLEDHSDGKFLSCNFGQSNNAQISVVSSSKAYIDNSIFTGTSSVEGGFVSGGGSSEIEFHNSKIICTAADTSSLRYNFSLNKLKRLVFDNLIVEGPTNYHLVSSDCEEITIQNCNFCPSNNGIQIRNCQNLTFTNNLMQSKNSVVITDTSFSQDMLDDSTKNQLTGTILINGELYFFDEEHNLMTGWYKNGTLWYHLDEDGSADSGWFHDIDNKWYYLSPIMGSMETGWIKVDGKWYLLGGSGAMKTGWQQSGGKWYYLTDSGAMAENRWIQTDGKWYYVGSDGAMLSNTKVNGYRLDKNGVWVS